MSKTTGNNAIWSNEPRLMDSPLSDRVYIAKKYRKVQDGMYDVPVKEDVTEDFEAIARNRGMVMLPKAADGRAILPGDRFLLEHNGKEITIRSVEYCGDGTWHVWPHESGGGITLPRASYDMRRI